MKKLDLLTDISMSILSQALNSFYNIEYENTERLYEYCDKGFVLLPKHQSNLDIILEGLLLKSSINRHGHYIMKDSLPGILEYVGGVPITRAREIKKLPKEMRLEKIAEARKKSEEVYGKLANLLKLNEIVVVHVEGKRQYQKKTKINTANVQSLLDMQKKVGERVTFFPLDIKYEDIKKFRSEILLKVGEPIKVGDYGLEDLTYHLARNIELLEA